MKRTFGQPNDVQAVDTFLLGIWKPVGGVRSVRHMRLVEKVGPVRHAKLAERCALLGVWDLSDLSEGVPCSAYGGLSKHAFFSALAENAAMGPDCMDLGTCCQETP